MTNAEKFQEIFKKFATEVWAFTEKDFLTWLNAEYKESTTKNDLGVDCINRQIISDYIESHIQEINTGYGDLNRHTNSVLRMIVDYIENMPSVTPQEQQTFKWCTDCKEYDQEKHCCHRWSKVIRNTVEEMKQEPILDKVKQAREKIDEMSRYTSVTGVTQYKQLNREDVLEILNELIESEK